MPRYGEKERVCDVVKGVLSITRRVAEHCLEMDLENGTDTPRMRLPICVSGPSSLSVRDTNDDAPQLVPGERDVRTRTESSRATMRRRGKHSEGES